MGMKHSKHPVKNVSGHIGMPGCKGGIVAEVEFESLHTGVQSRVICWSF